MASIKRNYIYNLSYQILTLLLPLITTPYISRVLGVDNIGVYSFTSSIVNYFILLATFGINLYGQREIAFNREDIEKKSEVFWNLILLRLVCVIISFTIYIIVILVWGQYKLLFLIQSLSIITCLFDVTWFCQGEENFGIIVLRNIIFRVFSIILLFVFVRKANDLWKYVFLTVLSGLISSVSLILYVSKRVMGGHISCLHPFYYLKPVFLLFIPQIAIEIYTVLDKSMIGFITASAYENGCYEQAQKISKMLLMVITSLGTVVVPRMSALWAKKDLENIKLTLVRSFKFMFAVSLPMQFGLICISDYFVPFFFGDGYEKVVPLLRIFTGLFLTIGISNIIGLQYLIPIKKEDVFTITVTIGAVSNFVLNIILIPKFGSVGGAIASVMAEGIIAGVQLIYARKIINVGFIFMNSWKIFTSAFIMALVIYSFKYFTNFNETLKMIIIIVTGVGVYATMLILLREELFYSILIQIKAKIFRSKSSIKPELEL